jgi:UDP-glucose 6-dehydrogenase
VPILFAEEYSLLSGSEEATEGVDFSLYQFIAVGTPPDEDGSADLSQMLSIAESIGRNMDDYRIVIDKSTVPVCTADLVRETIKSVLEERGKALDFDVVSNPGFLQGRDAVDDFMKPERHRLRRGQSAHQRASAQPLRAVQRQPRTIHRHGHPLGGADPVCDKSDACHQDQLHE